MLYIFIKQHLSTSILEISGGNSENGQLPEDIWELLYFHGLLRKYLRHGTSRYLTHFQSLIRNKSKSRLMYQFFIQTELPVILSRQFKKCTLFYISIHSFYFKYLIFFTFPFSYSQTNRMSFLSTVKPKGRSSSQLSIKWRNWPSSSRIWIQWLKQSDYDCLLWYQWV